MAELAKLRAALRRAIPEPRCELHFDTPWQLLIATILSAQSTDRNVNKVTPELFRLWPSPAALAGAPRAEVEALVKSTGFFRQKARNIQAASGRIAIEFDGEVPRDMDSLTSLPGVARKTANLVLGTAYGISSGIVVDTHAGRVARRLGLTVHEDPVHVERDLCSAFPRASWPATGQRLVLHGRYLCKARKPDCVCCALNELCASRESPPEGSRKAREAHEAELLREAWA